MVRPKRPKPPPAGSGRDETALVPQRQVVALGSNRSRLAPDGPAPEAKWPLRGPLARRQPPVRPHIRPPEGCGRLHRLDAATEAAWASRSSGRRAAGRVRRNVLAATRGPESPAGNTRLVQERLVAPYQPTAWRL